MEDILLVERAMFSLVKGRRANRNQRGVTLIEAALGLSVASVAMLGLAQLMAENAALARGKAAADRMNEVSEAASSYVRANWNALLAAASAGSPIVIPAGKASVAGGVPPGPLGLPSLQSGRFLSENFIDTNPWGQRHAVLIRKPAPAQLEVLVTTYGGVSIPDRTLIKIPAMIGGKAGTMLANPLIGTIGQVMGLLGGWQTDAATWSSGWAGGTTTPESGRIMANLSFDVQGITQPYLYRDNLGDPALNRMNTSLDLNNNDLNNAKAVGAQTVTTTSDVAVGGNLTVASGYAYVGSATVVGDLSVGGNQQISGSLGVNQDAIVSGDVYGREFFLSSMGNQPLSKAVFASGLYAPDDTVPKPSCRTGQNPQIFVIPAQFSDNGTGSTLSGAQAWAEDGGASWIVRLRVRTETNWVTPTSTYGGVVAFTKCS